MEKKLLNTKLTEDELKARIKGGEELKARLKKLGMSQEQFAESLAMYASTVGRWCRGETPIPPHIYSRLDLLDLTREMAQTLGLLPRKG